MSDTMTEPTTEEPCPPDEETPTPNPQTGGGTPTQQAVGDPVCAGPCRVNLCVPSSATATAGIPGTWTPSGSAVPILADIQSGHHPITASPLTAWTTGQYVQTTTPGTAGRIYWNGTAWVVGTAP